MEHVLEDKEEGELWEHGLPRREGYLPSTHANRLGDGIKQEYLWKMGRQYERVGPLKMGTLTAGASTVKWEKRTPLVHSHCSCGVGNFPGCNFHLRKYGIMSMMIHGRQRPK